MKNALREYAARVALVIHHARWAANDYSLTNDNQVDASSMQSAITITEWFKNEAKRIYGMFSESEDEAELRKLSEWIARKGGSVLVRDLQRNLRKYADDENAEEALEKMVQAGYGYWQPVEITER
jgi:Protein of unknown function (DUF3987)